ncbi:MAG: fluoride efflux transporter CrcB [Phototrophicaceae bacterium]
MINLLFIGAGAFFGANLRYIISGWVALRAGLLFPWGTLIVNFSGSLLLATFVAWSANQSGIDPRLRLLLVTGFFGAYTTFSTYAVESVSLFQNGNWMGALANVAGSNLVCLVAVLIGLAVGSRM